MLVCVYVTKEVIVICNDVLFSVMEKTNISSGWGPTVSFPYLVTLTRTTITTALTGRTVMSAVSPRFHHYFCLRTQQCGTPLCEAAFATPKLSLQKTQFNHVVVSLSPEIVVEIRNLILHPPADTPVMLIQWTANSEQHCLYQLVTDDNRETGSPHSC